MTSRVKACKNTAVNDVGVLRQNELSLYLIALKKDSLVLVCLHKVCFSEQNQFLTFHYFLSIRKKYWTYVKTP